jgi:hypothetical protein
MNSSDLDGAYMNAGLNNLSFSAGDIITFTASVGSGTVPPPVPMIGLSVIPAAGPTVSVFSPFSPALPAPGATATLTQTLPAGTFDVIWSVGYDPGSGFTQWLAYSPVWEVSCAAGPPVAPVANHYLCYDAKGDNPNEFVGLFDQFEGFGTNVRATRYFCNPVEKRKFDGPIQTTFPIVDPFLHYTCYDLTPTPNTKEQRVVFNQFVEKGDELNIKKARFLCAPTIKIDP